MLVEGISRYPVAAQPPEGPGFRGEQRVTAVDMIVGFESTSGRTLDVPRGLDPDDFELLLDGLSQPLVAVESRERTRLAGDWQIVVYFDESFVTQRQMRWAADLLAGQAAALSGLGAVEIIVADPEPMAVLQGVKDTAALEGVLQRLALEGSGSPDLQSLRFEFLRAFAGQIEAEELPDLAGRMEQAEVQMVRRHLDALLVLLAENRFSSSRRILILVTGGYDVDPTGFYGAWIPRPEGHGSGSRETSGDQEISKQQGECLEDVTELFSRTLAAYGWITAVLVAPDQPVPLTKGLRLGKWRFHGLAATREERREPEKAEALMEAGQGFLDRGDAEGAVEAYELAIYHFASDPRTSTLQGQAYLALSRALEILGDSAASRQALALAVAVDPSLAEEVPFAVATLLDPLQPLETLASTTSGEILREESSLADWLAGLKRRSRVTLQIAGLPLGELHEVELRSKNRNLRLRHPAWTRLGTPDAVSEARLRSLFDGVLLDAEIELDLWAEPEAEDPAGTIDLLVGMEDLMDESGGAAAEREILKISVAYLADSGNVHVLHETLIVDPGEGLVPSPHSVPIARARIAEGPLGVHVENLNTGRWGVGFVDLPDPDLD